MSGFIAGLFISGGIQLLRFIQSDRLVDLDRIFGGLVREKSLVDGVFYGVDSSGIVFSN